MKRLNTILETVLFKSRYILLVFYFGLVVALLHYAWVDIKEVWDIFFSGNHKSEDEMVGMLHLVDMAMIGGLVWMIIKGGYTSFICKYHKDDGEQTSSGVLKVKLSTTLVGVSSILLLQSFMNNVVDPAILDKQIKIYYGFLTGSLVLAIIDFLHVKSEAIHNEDEEKHKKVIEKHP